MPSHGGVLASQRWRAVNAAERVIRWSTALAVVGVSKLSCIAAGRTATLALCAGIRDRRDRCGRRRGPATRTVRLEPRRAVGHRGTAVRAGLVAARHLVPAALRPAGGRPVPVLLRA